MKVSTTILAGLSVFYTVSAPVVAVPTPEIRIEGRNFDSRFAPVARPVFPRNYYDNSTDSAPAPAAVKRSYPTATAARRAYPAGPTASALVFRSEPFAPVPKA